MNAAPDEAMVLTATDASKYTDRLAASVTVGVHEFT
jgi:hypothetical protein